MNIINNIAQHVKLKESKKVIEQFLIHLYLHGGLSTKHLAQELMLPVPVVTAIKKESIKAGLTREKAGVSLTDRGLHYVEKEMGYAGIDVELYTNLLFNRGFKNRYINKLALKIEQVYDDRPQVDVTLDQAFATAKTAVKRAILVLENFTLIGKSVLCVGDDDLVSVALGFLLQELFPNNSAEKTRIVVLDVDQGILDYIGDVGKQQGFAIECYALNLKQPLPAELLNAFDCFFTDPPYTHDGMALFLSRGIDALKKEKGNNVFLSFGKKPLEENFKIQQEIIHHGLSIKAIIDSFNEYHGASLLGSRSQMFILESTEGTQPLVSSDGDYEKPIYTREMKPLERQYQCKVCGEIIVMSTQGKTPFKTIEQLKSEGCPKCGGGVFDLMNKRDLAEVEERKAAVGSHVIADLFECSQAVLKDKALIREYMIEAAKLANATIVSENFNTFDPWGVSGVIVIKESHLTVHTWPEYNYAAIDLFTCGSHLELSKALEYLKEQFKCGRLEQSNLLRGEFPNRT